MINPKYVMKKMVLDKNTIKNFFIDADGRRQIRNGQVKAIVDHLKQGEHYSSPLVVNEQPNGKLKMVDGNHRYESIKVVISADQQYSISSWVAVYNNLTPDEEREVYREWNVGVKQSATDFLKAHWDTIPMRRRILSELPVSIYGDKTHMPVKSFVGNQIMAKKNSRNFSGGYSGGIYDVVGDFHDLTPEDIDALKEFSKFIEKVLGPYQSKKTFYTTTAISAVYQIWYDNKDQMTQMKLKAVFDKILNPQDKLLVEASKAGGRSAATNFYNGLIYRINKKSKVCITTEEAFTLKEQREKEKQKAIQIIQMVRKT